MSGKTARTLISLDETLKHGETVARDERRDGDVLLVEVVAIRLARAVVVRDDLARLEARTERDAQQLVFARRLQSSRVLAVELVGRRGRTRTRIGEVCRRVVPDDLVCVPVDPFEAVGAGMYEPSAVDELRWRHIGRAVRSGPRRCPLALFRTFAVGRLGGRPDGIRRVFVADVCRANSGRLERRMAILGRRLSLRSRLSWIRRLASARQARPDGMFSERTGHGRDYLLRGTRAAGDVGDRGQQDEVEGRVDDRRQEVERHAAAGDSSETAWRTAGRRRRGPERRGVLRHGRVVSNRLECSCRPKARRDGRFPDDNREQSRRGKRPRLTEAQRGACESGRRIRIGDSVLSDDSDGMIRLRMAVDWQSTLFLPPEGSVHNRDTKLTIRALLGGNTASQNFVGSPVGSQGGATQVRLILCAYTIRMHRTTLRRAAAHVARCPAPYRAPPPAGLTLFRTSASAASNVRPRPSGNSAPKATPPIFEARNAAVYPLGVPSDDPAHALFRELNWTVDDKHCWALLAPSSASGTLAALLATLRHHVRFSPFGSAGHPILKVLPPVDRPAEEGGPRDRTVDDLLKVVSFKTRLGASAEFDDYTARYFSIRDEDRVTLREHLVGATQATEAAILERADQLEMRPFLDLPLITLSNGQTRRARILRALLEEPELLILEEPFSAPGSSPLATSASVY